MTCLRLAVSACLVCSIAFADGVPAASTQQDIQKSFAKALSSAFNPLGIKSAPQSTLPQLYSFGPDTGSSPIRMVMAVISGQPNISTERAQFLARAQAGLAQAQAEAGLACSIPLLRYKPSTTKRFFFRAANPANPNIDPGSLHAAPAPPCK